MNIDSGLQLLHNNKIVPLTDNYGVEIPANAAGAMASERLIDYFKPI